MNVSTEWENHSTLTTAVSMTDIESDTTETKGDHDTPPQSPQSQNILKNNVIL